MNQYPHAPPPPLPPPQGMPRWLTALLAIAVVAAGVVIAVVLVKTAPEVEKAKRTAVVPTVEVATVSKGTQPVAMMLQGEVKPARSVVVMPEVSGKVVWQADELIPGGRFAKGENILRIDPRDLQLQLRQQKAQVAAQRLLLKQEKGRRKVAMKEWEYFEEQRKEAGLDPFPENDPGRDLALRIPQVDNARVQVRAAKSAAAQTELRLSRTVLQAPFNAIVKTEAVDIGQYVAPGTQLMTLVGTDQFWVQVSVPMSKLHYIVFPKDGQPGSKAQVSVDTGGARVDREGEVIRLLADLDPVGRLARLLVSVDEPLKVEEESAQVAAVEGGTTGPKLPLLLGSFADVEIEGVTLEGVTEIPRVALRENDQVYVLTGDSKLRIDEVEIVWGDAENVLVNGPLKTGDKVIISPLVTAVDGMDLQEATSSEAGGKEARREQ